MRTLLFLQPQLEDPPRHGHAGETGTTMMDVSMAVEGPGNLFARVPWR